MNNTYSTTGTRTPPVGLTEPNIALAVAYGLVLVVALLGNVATICNFKYNDWLKIHRCHVYILGLAVADLGTALVPLPVNALIAAQGLWPLNRQACMAYDYFRLVIENNGVLITLLISADRYRLLWSDFSNYIKGSTSLRVSLEIGLTWLVPALGHGIMAVVWIITVPLAEREAETTLDCQDVPSDADVPFSTMYAVLLILIPGLVLGVLNTSTFIGVARKLKRRRQIGGGIAFRGPPSSTFGTRKKPTANPGRDEVAVPGDVRATESKGPEIPAVSVDVAYHQQGGLEGTSSDNRETSDATVSTENAGKPGPSAQSEEPMPTSDIPRKVPQHSDLPSRIPNAKQRRDRRHTDRNMTRYVRPAIMLAGIVSVFALCWFPFATYYIYVHIVCPTCFSVEVQLWLRCLMYSSSALNPFIYALTERKLRKWYVKIWRGLRLRLAGHV